MGIKGIKPQGKPVWPTKAGLEPNNRNRPKGRGIETRSRRKGGISSTYNFQCVLLTSQN